MPRGRQLLDLPFLGLRDHPLLQWVTTADSLDTFFLKGPAVAGHTAISSSFLPFLSSSSQKKNMVSTVARLPMRMLATGTCRSSMTPRVSPRMGM